MSMAGQTPTNAQIPAPAGSFAAVAEALMQTLEPAADQRDRLASEIRALALDQWAHRRFGSPPLQEEWLALVALIVQAARSTRPSPPPEGGCS